LKKLFLLITILLLSQIREASELLAIDNNHKLTTAVVDKKIKNWAFNKIQNLKKTAKING